MLEDGGNKKSGRKVGCLRCPTKSTLSLRVCASSLDPLPASHLFFHSTAAQSKARTTVNNTSAAKRAAITLNKGKVDVI